ncbi:MAG: GntR family transcriptional regulator [Agathobacter sp.]|uniref:GntR family transcriptional regulator n=1 Tax=Agathobacter sp. TaxID=2021311 RepID=UPI0025839778|nr:GntR family transcriptional regulator [Agathobacter sp.]MCR5677381.1 GntR family transcriptional regulator [Agathobacter sp.]
MGNVLMKSLVTSDDIYLDICNKIENLEYMPGDRLSENELASRYGVSRHIVRGALAALKNRRLVEVYPQRGTFVSLIDTEYISDILYMRESVEQEAICRIIESGDVESIVKHMRSAIEAQKKLKEGADFSQKFYELDNLFHEVLFDAVGRPHVMELIADPYIHIRRWRNYEVRTPERIREIMLEHEEIADAIEQKDRDKARVALHKHLDTASRYSKPLKEVEAQYFA